MATPNTIEESTQSFKRLGVLLLIPLAGSPVSESTDAESGGILFK